MRHRFQWHLKEQGLSIEYHLLFLAPEKTKGYMISQWLIGGLGWWFGFLGFPHERDCFLGIPLESQTTTNPNYQLTIG